MNDKKYTKSELEKLQDETDYKRLKHMTEDQIEKNAEEDPDSLSPTEAQMKKFKKIKNEKK